MAYSHSVAQRLKDELVQLTLRDFQAGLQLLYPKAPPDIIVYGSFARGEATEDSDLDLLLLYSRPVDTSREIMHLASLLADLNLRYGMLISVLPVSMSDYKRAEGPFWRNVRREGMAINASR